MLRFDEIAHWSEIKLDIVREYASAYSKILSARTKPKLSHVYVDGFSGAGEHISKMTGDMVAGSPLNALAITPPFNEYVLIDLNGDKVCHLRDLVGARPDVSIKQGNCNRILLDEVLPRIRYEDYRRGLLVLDPYGLHLDWRVLETAGQMQTIDLFLNLPIMDINRNALWRGGPGTSVEQLARMTAFWGDESWRSACFTPHPQLGLFGDEKLAKQPNQVVVDAFCERLKGVAGFDYVPQPMPMRNSVGAVVYYLFFATHKPVAEKIVSQIFAKYAKPTNRVA